MNIQKLLNNTETIPWTGCMIWMGGLTTQGYARIYINRRSCVIHRIISNAKKDEITRHKCDVRSCINPEHLLLGTPYDNAQDRVKHGNNNKGERHPKSKLKNIDVLEIRKYISANKTSTQISKLYNVTRSCINDIKWGRRWGWLNE